MVSPMLFRAGSTPADLLRTARREAHLTQTELARHAGTTQSAVARLESGRTSPNVETLARLLEAAGQTLTVGSAPSASGRDVDLSQLRALRRLTPAQRVAAFESTYEDARALAAAARRARALA